MTRTAIGARPRPPPASTLFPYTTLFRSLELQIGFQLSLHVGAAGELHVFHFRGGIEKEQPLDDHLRMLHLVDRLFLDRSEEHTSELQSLAYLVCRLLLEKKKNTFIPAHDALRHDADCHRRTAPPAPGVYALSLHDALPISRASDRLPAEPSRWRRW